MNSSSSSSSHDFVHKDEIIEFIRREIKARESARAELLLKLGQAHRELLQLEAELSALRGSFQALRPLEPVSIDHGTLQLKLEQFLNEEAPVEEQT